MNDNEFSFLARSSLAVVVAWNAPQASDPDERTISLRLPITTYGDHRIWTLMDICAERALQERIQCLKESLDTAQELGRLGVWERELASGRGRWDDHVSRFWEFDPDQGTPTFAQAAQRIHPDDRNSGEFLQSSRRARRYSQRFACCSPTAACPGCIRIGRSGKR